MAPADGLGLKGYYLYGPTSNQSEIGRFINACMRAIETNISDFCDKCKEFYESNLQKYKQLVTNNGASDLLEPNQLFNKSNFQKKLLYSCRKIEVYEGLMKSIILEIYGIFLIVLKDKRFYNKNCLLAPKGTEIVILYSAFSIYYIVCFIGSNTKKSSTMKVQTKHENMSRIVESVHSLFDKIQEEELTNYNDFLQKLKENGHIKYFYGNYDIGTYGVLYKFDQYDMPFFMPLPRILTYNTNFKEEEVPDRFAPTSVLTDLLEIMNIDINHFNAHNEMIVSIVTEDNMEIPIKELDLHYSDITTSEQVNELHFDPRQLFIYDEEDSEESMKGLVDCWNEKNFCFQLIQLIKAKRFLPNIHFLVFWLHTALAY